ncbi:MAG: MMPL family transporter [Verrucomicrobiota bacterium]
MQNSNRLESIGRTIAAFSIRFRWALVPLTLIGCALIAFGASTLRFAGDYRVFFGADNPDFIANENAQATFGRPDNIAFVLIPKDGTIYTQETIAAVHELTNRAWALPYVSRVDSLTNFQYTTGQNDDLIVDDLVFDSNELTKERIGEIRQIASNEDLLNGFIVSRDGAATIVNAVVQFPADGQNIATQVAAEARAIRSEIQETHPHINIHLTGVASLSAAFEEAGLRDSSTLIPLVYAFILIVMLIALRSFSGVIGSLALIMLSTFVGVGIGGFMGVELTPISLAAPTIILTIAVADAIHILAGIRGKMRSGVPKREAIIASTGLNFSPIGITSITTVVGFLTLNFSDSPPFHHLGNMSAAGIAAAWLLSITFLPAILAILPLKFKAVATDGRRPFEVVERIAEWVIARPKQILVGTLTLCLGAISFIPRLEINDQWSQYFDESLEFRQAIDAADPYFGSDTVEFILDPGEPGAVTDPTFLRRIDAFATWLRTQEEKVAHVYALSDIMKRVNKNLNNDDPAFFRIPDNRAVASQYLLVYELSLPYGLDLNDRVDIDRQMTRVTASMKDISTDETKAFIASARDWFDQNGGGYDLEITGSKVLFAFVAQRNIEAVFEGAGYLIIAIFIILTLAFRSVKVGLISLIPNVLPLLSAFGVWALFVGVVGFSVAAVGAVAVGLIVDFTVHFLSKYLRARQQDRVSIADAIRYAFRTAGTAIFLTTVILAAGFSVLVTSTFKLNADMGLLTAIAVILAMLINLLLLPAMLLLFGKEEEPQTGLVRKTGL